MLAEMIHEQALRLPDDFFNEGNTSDVLLETLVNRLKEKFNELTSTYTNLHQQFITQT